MIIRCFVKWLQQIAFFSSAPSRAGGGGVDRAVDSLPHAGLCATCFLHNISLTHERNPGRSVPLFPFEKTCPRLLRNQPNTTQGPEPRSLAPKVCSFSCITLGTNLYFPLLSALLLSLSLSLDGTCLALVTDSFCQRLGVTRLGSPALPRAKESMGKMPRPSLAWFSTPSFRAKCSSF